jgi:hypothetical protein
VVGQEGRIHFRFDPAVLPGPVSQAWYRSESQTGDEYFFVNAKQPDCCTFVLSQRHPKDGPYALGYLLESTGNGGSAERPSRQVRIDGAVGGAGRLYYTPRCAACASALVWQPANGLWAMLHMSGTEAAHVRMARGLRLDTVYRIAVPFRLAWLPEGARLLSARQFYDQGEVTAGAFLAVGDPDRHGVIVNVNRGATLPTSVTPPDTLEHITVNGRPAVLINDLRSEVRLRGFSVSVDLGGGVIASVASWGLDRATVTRIAGGVRSLHPAGPPGWTTDPLR